MLALAVGLTVIWGLARAPLSAYIPYQPLIPCLAVFFVIVIAEWLLRRMRGLAEPSELAAAPLRTLSLTRVALRLLGFAATLALVALGYWLFPEYHGGFYQPYWQFLRTLAPCVILVPLYFLWADTRARTQEDEFLQFGRLLMGGTSGVDAAVIRRHLLGWTVKAFFLPLMTVYLAEEFTFLYGMMRTLNLSAFTRYDAWFHLCYAIDLLFCVIGYTATTRLLDSHMRSVEPTLAGWLVALICYQPFYSLIGRSYLQYEGSVTWDSWLNPLLHLRDGVGVAIIVLSVIYAVSTVAFGLRFSNLTHRGIITGGPYRFTKHPAYLSKNLSWWLISVPFALNAGALSALRHCVLLLMLNGVYFLRARTEERHLSRDPAYVAYALWINEHGLLAGVGRVLPWLRYRSPVP
jgi:isoprenylcysteine carboxyl methyltransferase (ICMT) family protein YpbQ